MPLVVPDDGGRARLVERSLNDSWALGSEAPKHGLGMIGALVDFFGSAVSGSDNVLAFPEAMFWLAILDYRLFRGYDH